MAMVCRVIRVKEIAVLLAFSAATLLPSSAVAAEQQSSVPAVERQIIAEAMKILPAYPIGERRVLSHGIIARYLMRSDITGALEVATKLDAGGRAFAQVAAKQVDMGDTAGAMRTVSLARDSAERVIAAGLLMQRLSARNEQVVERPAAHSVSGTGSTIGVLASAALALVARDSAATAPARGSADAKRSDPSASAAARTPEKRRSFLLRMASLLIKNPDSVTTVRVAEELLTRGEERAAVSILSAAASKLLSKKVDTATSSANDITMIADQLIGMMDSVGTSGDTTAQKNRGEMLRQQTRLSIAQLRLKSGDTTGIREVVTEAMMFFQLGGGSSILRTLVPVAQSAGLSDHLRQWGASLPDSRRAYVLVAMLRGLPLN